MRLITRPLQKQPVISDDVWSLISPSIPDCLEYLGDGIYQATWWKPVPRMDVELMKMIPGVEAVGEAFEPTHLPGGVSICFQLALAN